MLRKLKWQIPGEPLAARYYWCQGPVPGRGPAVEKHCSRLQLGWNLVRTWTRKQAIKTRVLTFFLTPTSFIRSKSFPILHASCYHRHHYHISKPQILTASCNKQHKIRTRDSLFELIRYSTSDRLPYLLWPREPGYHSSARTLHVVTQIVSHIKGTDSTYTSILITEVEKCYRRQNFVTQPADTAAAKPLLYLWNYCTGGRGRFTVGWPNNHLIGQPKQPTNQSQQPTNKLTNQPTKQPTNQPTNQNNRPTNHPTN